MGQSEPARFGDMSGQLKGTIDMDETELKKLAQELFAAAMVDASNDGETVMEGGGDEYYHQTASGPDLLRAAASFFNDR